MRGELWIVAAARNARARLTAGTRPVAREEFPAVRGADAVGIDERRGRVYVRSRAAGVTQILDR